MSDDKTVVEATTSQAEQVENVVKKVWTDVKSRRLFLKEIKRKTNFVLLKIQLKNKTN